MSATIRAAASAATATEADKTVTVTKPAGTADGDLLIAFFAIRRPASDPVITPPSGWIEIDARDVTAPALGHFRAYKRIAISEPANYTWTWDQDAQGIAGIVALDSHDGIDSFEVTTNTAGGVNHNTGDLFLSQASELVLAFFTLSDDSSFTPPTGFAENFDTASGVSNGITGMLCNKVFTNRGLTGVQTAVSAIAETGFQIILGVKDPAVAEVTEGSVKRNTIGFQDASTAVEVISAEPGFRLGVQKITVAAAGTMTVTVQDSGGRPLWVTGFNGGGTQTKSFERDETVTAIGKAIQILGSNTTLVGAQVVADILE